VVALATLALGVALWSYRWPSVKGRIDISILDQETGWDSDHTGGRTEIARTQKDKFYLSYSYSINGVAYAGSRIAPFADVNWHLSSGGDSHAWSRARDKAKWYREGSAPDVYYCPIFPAWACLEPGGIFTALMLGAAAGGLFWLL
jgi:hypothetical protein